MIFLHRARDTLLQHKITRKEKEKKLDHRKNIYIITDIYSNTEVSKFSKFGDYKKVSIETFSNQNIDFSKKYS